MADEKKIRVLLADDNEVNRSLTKEILESSGYAVDAVENGREAVLAFAESKYQCVLMDAEMPLMGGIEATGAIRGLEKKKAAKGKGRVPIICITAHPEKEFGDEARRAGMDDCAVKPVDYSILLTKMDEWMKMPDGKKKQQKSGPAQVRGNAEILDVEKSISQFGKDRELFAKLLDTFLRNANGQIKTIEEAYGTVDTDTIIHQAHSIRGACVTLAAGRLAGAAAALEKALRNDGGEKVEPLIENLKSELKILAGHARTHN